MPLITYAACSVVVVASDVVTSVVSGNASVTVETVVVGSGGNTVVGGDCTLKYVFNIQ